MRRWMTAAALAVLVATGLTGLSRPADAQAHQEQPCAVEPCTVADGQYRAVPPANWDGASPLPAVMFFHGWQATAQAMLNNRALMDGFHAEGLLVVLPDGRDKTWAHVGSPSQARDELPFIDAVRADVTARYPIDTARFWVSGFSQGGSMAWDVACYRGADYVAFVPVAGAFWQPLPATCADPVNLRHIHGTADTVVPMAGRPIRTWRQGDVRRALTIVAATNRCASEPAAQETVGGLICEIWPDCTSGKALRLCLHDGGHQRPAGWIDDAWAWVQTVADAEAATP